MTRRRRAARWARRVRRSWERTACGLWRRKLPFALTAGVVAVSLALVGLVRLGATWAESLADSWGGGAHMVIYMHPRAGASEAAEVARALGSLSSVERAEYVSPDDAMVRLEDAFGDQSDALTGVEPALLPASVEVTLKGGAPDAAAARAIEARLASVDAIEEIEVLGEWVERLDSAARGLRALGEALFLIVAAACAFVVAAALELGLRARRRERALLEVLGASPMAARAPIVIEGALLGAVGAGGALGIVYAVHEVTHHGALALMAHVVGGGQADFLSAAEMTQLVAVGAAAGLVGGALASRRGRAS